MDMLQYKFLVWKGEKRVEVQAPYTMLSDLSNCSRLQIDEAVSNLQALVEGKIDFYTFGASDACIVDSAEMDSMIFYEFGEKDTTIDTSEILKLMIDFQNFHKTTKSSSHS